MIGVQAWLLLFGVAPARGGDDGAGDDRERAASHAPSEKARLDTWQVAGTWLGGGDRVAVTEPGFDGAWSSPMGELRIGAEGAHTGPGMQWTGTYSGTLQTWTADDGWWLDDHLAEVWLLGPGAAAGGGILALRGSGQLGWSEAAALAAGRLRARSVRVGVGAGVAGRTGPPPAGLPEVDASGAALAGHLVVSSRPSPQLAVEVRGDARRWVSGDLPPWSIEASAATRWTPHPRVLLDASAGMAAVAGADAFTANPGMPLPGTTAILARFSPGFRFSQSVAIAIEAGMEQGLGESNYVRTHALAGASVALGRARARGAPPADPSGVQFHVEAPRARSVEVAGSFNGWEPVPMQRAQGGRWTLDVPVTPGVYEFVYLVDGVPLTPPEAARRRPDGFGGNNGVLVVGDRAD